MSIAQILQDKIMSAAHGWVFCANDFSDIGSKGNTDVILHRLSKQGTIRQLGYGLYDLPKKSELLGDLSPDIKDIINAYSRKTGQSFVLDPLNATNALGITTQVPSQLTYLTDGKSHILHICGLDIHLVHTSPKKLVGATTSIGIIIQALRYFGPQGVPDHVIKLIAKKISKEDLDCLIAIKNKIMRNLLPSIDRITRYATIY
jgi:Family of unknown function (DUF6088)